MTHIAPSLNRDRFTAMHRRQHVRHLQELCARAFLIAAVLAAAAVTGYLIGITTTTATAMPALLAEAQTRAAW